MKPTGPALVVAALVTSLLAAPLIAQEEAPVPVEGMEVRSYEIRHLPAREANAIIRSLMSVRKSAIDEERNLVLLHDSPDRLRRAEEILAMIDRPDPRWSATLAAETDEGSREIKTLQLGGSAAWTAGDAPGGMRDHVHVSLESDSVGDELRLKVEVLAAAGGNVGGQSFRRRLSEWLLLRNGESVELLRADDAESREALGAVLATGSPVRALTLSVRHDGSRAERTAGERKLRR